MNNLANTFRKIYKKTGNSGSDADYQLVGNVGVDGVELDIMKGATSSSAGEIGLVPKPTKEKYKFFLRASGIWDCIYPIGSIYFSVNNVNPSEYFGGTWVAWGSGRVPVGVNSSDGSFNSVEKTGGASTVTLSTAQIPSHTHKVSGSTNSTGSHSHRENDYLWANQKPATVSGHKHQILVDNAPGGVWFTCRTQGGGMRAEMYTDSAGTHSHTFSCTSGSSGSGNSHTNLQPYITCYMWKRTA